MVSRVIQLAVLAAAFTNAAPFDSVNTTANGIFKRATIQPVSCGASATNMRAWPLESVQDAFNGFAMYGNLPTANRPTAGTRAYPMQYGNPTPSDDSVVNALNGIPGCETGQAGYKYFEFPITDPAFTGGAQGSQGPDRVIAIAPNIGPGGTRMYTYCLSITHRDEVTEGDFDPCTNAP